MKTSHKALLTFAITALSTLSGGTHSSRMQALLEETYPPAALIADSNLSQTVAFQTLEPKRSLTAPEASKHVPTNQRYTILPVADTLNQSVW